MIEIKRIYTIIVLILLAFSIANCRKNPYLHRYIDLVQLFPYLSKAFEAQKLKFINKDIQWSNYILMGFSTYGDQLPRTWAVEKESTIIVFFTHPEKKNVSFHCRPFNPPNQPIQVGDIYFNGAFLKTIKFSKKGRYEFQIPAALIHYGSNRLLFKWKYVRSPNDFKLNRDKRNFVMGFANLTFSGEAKLQKRKKLSRVYLQTDKMHAPTIYLPQAGIIEYYITLPPASQPTQLRFSLNSPEKHLKDSEVHIAIYGERGEKKILHLNPSQFANPNRLQMDLKEFAGQTIRIVFANSIQNHPNFTISITDAAIYSVTGHNLPLQNASIMKKQSLQTEIQKPHFQGTPPHVFIYLIDTLRADHMSCYGYSKLTTPFIDSFSKESLFIKNCFSAASWTKPAAGSILTGLYPNKHKGEDQTDKLSTDVETLAEILKANGFETIHITPNVNTSKEVNFDQGVDHYLFSQGGRNINTFYHSSEYINRELSEILDKNPKINEKPIFAFLHTVDPHDPYTPKEPFLKFKKDDPLREGLGLPDNIRIKNATTGLTTEDIEYIKGLYDCEILHNDYYFGEFLKLLRQKNLYDNSIIILVADHGEQFKEHGGLFHGSGIYNEEIHVPLIIKFPGKDFSGKRCDINVSQVDIYPTILEYLGIPISPTIDGSSIFNLLNEKQSQRILFVKEKLNRDEKHKSNFLGMISNKGNQKHIITYENELFINAANIENYDLARDFKETHNNFDMTNLFQFRHIKFLADYFLHQMESVGIKKSESLDLNKLDPEKLKQLRALGYIN